MGLDAFVRCRCFEEGKVTDPPLPIEDLYVSDEGFVESRMLNEKREQLGWERFDRQYGELARQLHEWSRTCCEHEDMEICSEWVCNAIGWGELSWLFKQLGYETPVLAEMLPEANGGSFPSSLAPGALAELDVLESRLPTLMPDTYTDLMSSRGCVC